VNVGVPASFLPQPPPQNLHHPPILHLDIFLGGELMPHARRDSFNREHILDRLDTNIILHVEFRPQVGGALELDHQVVTRILARDSGADIGSRLRMKSKRIAGPTVGDERLIDQRIFLGGLSPVNLAMKNSPIVAIVRIGFKE